MCGFTVTYDKIPNLIRHRGIKEINLQSHDWYVNFNSLPLSSAKSSIEQPMWIDNHMIVFNGEIFNYKELSLPARPESDLDYIYSVFQNPLQLYAESTKWDGFWSIAIIDPNGTLFFFTDWLGKKQLYYNATRGLASEIKPVIDFETDLSPEDFMMDYTEEEFGGPKTNFKDVYRALPGSLYRWRYGSIPLHMLKIQPGVHYHPVPWEKLLPRVIFDSVSRRLENRIDGVSILLSSGLDSNIILHELLKITRNVEVVSHKGPESEMVERIANYHSLKVKWVEEDLSVLPEAVKAYECSLDYGSLIPNYLLFKACSNHVVLTGDGSDEFFSGYGRSVVSDTFFYDTFLELPYYHNVRIDRMSMIHTKEARSPLMSYPLLNLIQSMPLEERKGKQCLRKLYRGILPNWIIENKKIPLRTSEDKQTNLLKTKQQFYESFK